MRIASDIRRTYELYDEMHKVLGLPAEVRQRVVPRISAWSPLQQIGHISKSNQWILSSVVAIVVEGDKGEEGSIKPIGRIVLRSGYIPRGIGKAPTTTTPDDIPVETLENELDLQKDRIDLISANVTAAKQSSGKFRHPYFGHFNAMQWIRFVRIHTNHHMKIVREILSSGDL